MHWHDEIEFIYIKKGKGIISLNLIEYTVTAGDIIMILPGMIHGIFQKETFDIKKSIITDLNDGICRSFVIPAGAKEKILGELDSIGINHAFLFPELEHQASYIRQKYLDLMQEQE